MMKNRASSRAQQFLFTAALLASLSGATSRADTSLYVSDTGIGYSRIQRYDATGTPIDSVFTTALGRATSMATDSSGYLYASFGFSSGPVRKYSHELVDLGVFNTNSLAALTFDKSGFLYGAVGNSILKISPAGVATPFAFNTNGTPVAMTLDASGNLYAANSSTHSVQKFDSNGNDLGVFADTGSLAHPTGMSIDSAGYLFVAVGDAQSVFKFQPNGAFDSTFASGNMVSYPTSAVIDSSDNLYVQGQDSFHTIKRFAPDGSGQVLVGGGLGSFGTLAISEVPEPSVIALSGMGLAGGWLAHRRKRRA